MVRSQKTTYHETETEKETRWRHAVEYLRAQPWANDGGTKTVHVSPEFDFAALANESVFAQSEQSSEERKELS